MNSPKAISGLLRDGVGERLEGMLQRCQRLRALEQRLYDCLDISVSGHCRLLNVQGRRLVLGVSSPAWASRIRYQIPALLTCVQRLEGMEGVEGIDLRVLPKEAAPREARKRDYQPMQLSRHSAQLIDSCAEHIDDEALRRALKHLAGRGRQDPG